MLESDIFSLLESTLDAAFAVREGGEICFWSPSAEQLFGFTAEQAVGNTCFALLDGSGALGTRVCHDRCSVMQCTHRTEAVPDFDLNVRTASGQRLWVNVSTLAYENRRAGRFLTIHLARDITARKQRSELTEKMIALSQEVVALARQAEGAAPVTPLTPQEVEILRRFAAGVSATQVARLLKISPQTLRNHLHRINQKLRTHNRLEAVMHAIQRGLI
jgi:PAS domain S-box-containing protein